MDLPAHLKADSGKVANTGALRGASRIEEGSVVSDEHMIVPLAPPPATPATAATPPPQGPAATAAEPPPSAEALLPSAEAATTAEETAATAAKLAAAAVKLAATAAKLAAAAERLAAAAVQANAARSNAKPQATATASRQSPAPGAAPAPTAQPSLPVTPETVALDEAVFDQIRLEIKRRLPYFQACADAARRRGSSEVRRVAATWTIAADGAIKEMKVDGVPDPQLAACITRMGRQPFTVQPGTELTIPTPIIFVR